MDVNGIIADLRSELELMNDAIMALERIAYGQKSRRGRPPLWLKTQQSSEAEAPAPKRRGRPRKAI